MTKTEPGAGGADFYRDLAPFTAFSSLADPGIYTALPDGWLLGLSDIVNSTEAIAAGRYKEVNTAAAAVIAALNNALPDSRLPFVFGGDGAAFAVDPEGAAVAGEALASTARWIGENFGLMMRVAMVPVRTIRERGLDVRVARFELATGLSYAMFSGGGLAFAEARMKLGDFAIPEAPAQVRPDLTGLSCRFRKIPAQNGVIQSLIVMPKPRGDQAAFERAVRALLAIVDAERDGGRPVPAGGPDSGFTLSGFLQETKTASAKMGRSRLRSMLTTARRTFLAYLTFVSGRTVGAFDPRRYVRELVENSDFRKYDDGLRMTLDCMPATADRIETLLARAAADGTLIYGCHRQAEALLTCFVPSPDRSDHVHFVDGASGGYALAAQSLKGAFATPASSSAASEKGLDVA